MAKKGKKGKEQDEEPNLGDSKPIQKVKKGKGKRRGDDSEDEADAAAAPVAAPVEAPSSAAADHVVKKKDKKKKKGKNSKQDLSDDDGDGQSLAPSKPSSSGQKQSVGASGFSQLMADEGDNGDSAADQQDSDPDNLVVVGVEGVKRHPKSSTLQIIEVFDGHEMYKVVTDAPDIEVDSLVVLAKPGCVTPGSQKSVGITKVQGVKCHGMLCTAFDVGWTETDEGELLILKDSYNLISGDVCPMSPPQGWVVDNPQVVEDEEAPSEDAEDEQASDAEMDNDDEIPMMPSESVPPPQVSSSGSKKSRKMSAASAFSMLDDDEEPETRAKSAADAFASLGLDDAEAPAAGASGKKGKKKAAAVNAFAGLGGEDSEDEPVPEVSTKGGKKGKKKAAAASAFAGLGGDDSDVEPEVEPEPEIVTKKSKKDKKKDKAKNAFAGLGDTDDEGVEVSAPEPVPEKKSKKSKSKAAAANAFADLDEPEPEPVSEPVAPAPAGKKGKKGKGKAAAADEEDLDAILAELGGPAPASSAPVAPAAEEEKLDTVEAVQAALDVPGISTTKKKKLKAKLKSLQDEAGAATEDKDEDSATVASVQLLLENKSLNANQKKKLKAKLKKLQDKEAAGGDAPVAKEAPTSKGGKKPSAAVLAMQQAVEDRRIKEEAEALALIEENRLAKEALEAEIAKEKQAAEDKIRRGEERQARKEQLRKEGKLLSAKQKQEQARLALVRGQMIAQAKEQGIDLEDETKPKKVSALDRKKQQKELKRKAEEEAKAKADEEEAARIQAQQDARAAAAAKKAEEEAAANASADDWEDVADDWADSEPEAEPEIVDKDLDADKGAASDDESESESESDSESDSDSDDSDSDSDTDDSTDSEDAREQRIEEARRRRELRFKAAMEKRDQDDLRSPICCILGHVDTGKTKILDNIRRTNVQDGEAGGITQQIGATYIPSSAVEDRTVALRAGKEFDMKMPGLLVIDTPGHESFSNLRTRGSSLCDIAVLVVDIMHGLEPQTIESINMLKARKSPFIIALNKIDRMYQWKTLVNGPVRDSLAQQSPPTQDEFDKRVKASMLELSEQGLNVELYWKNRDPRRYVSIVPTSAITGEGVCDLMWLIVKLTQSMMTDRLMFVEEMQCTVLEVKMVEGYGTTIDAVLVNGRIREGDKIVVCGLDGAIVTQIRSLLTPHPMKELRVKNTYLHFKEIKAAQGVKISAPGLEKAVAGTQLYVVRKDDDVEELKELVMEDMADIFSKVDKTGEGVCVQASTLGSLEALLEFLSSDAVKIPVSGIHIGPVHKKDIMRASVMLEKKGDNLKKYACILAFDVPVTREAQEMATKLGVRVFTADIIYHLFDQFSEYTKQCKLEEQEEARDDAVFPVRMRIMPGCVFNAKDPIVLGVEIIEGQIRIGSPVCVGKDLIDLGRVVGLERDHKAVEKAEAGQSVAMKIEATNSTEGSRLFGRHFDIHDELCSRISRDSINALKMHFRDQMTRQDWELVIKMKKQFKVD